MRSLPALSIKNPVFAWMLMSSLILFGAISVSRMGISQLPDVDFPVISVSIALPGAAPEVMESTVVDILESSFTSIEGIKSMNSTVKTGSANISLEFDIEKDIDRAIQDVQTQVAQAQRRLPKDAEPPVVSKSNPEDQPILWIGVTSTKLSTRELMVLVRDQIKDAFTTVPGVADIFMGGYVEPGMRIWAQPQKMSQYQMTVNDIIGAIQAEHSEPPSGKLEQGKEELNLRTMGEAKTVQDFESIRINTRGGSPNFAPIALNQVSRIEEGLGDVRRKSRVNGLQAVGLGIRKQRGSNAVAVGEAAIAKMEQIKKTLPSGVSLELVFDNTQFVKESVHELNYTLIVSVILTSLVIWFFLGSWASTINVLMSIPTSILGAFIVLYFAGFTLNTFTLLGLSLAVGIVVDDAIMVLENIVRHREMGKNRVLAALDGSNEIYFAAMAASISIVAIFLPVAFMKGVIGKFFFQFGVTMTAAVMLSLVEAVTLTPMRASQLGEKTTSHDKPRFLQKMDAFFDFLKTLYTKTLARALNHRVKIIIAAIAFFVASLGVNKWINKEFLPSEDQSRFMARILAPSGSTLQYTDSKIQEAEKILQSIPEVRKFFVSIGSFDGSDANIGLFFISLKQKNERKRTQFEVMDQVRAEFSKIPELKVFIQDLSMRSFSSGRGYPIEFAIQGPEWEVLTETSTKIMEEMKTLPRLRDIDTDYLLGMPELQIIPDRAKAAARGVSIEQIGRTVNALMAGTTAGYYSDNGHRYEILVKVEGSEKTAKEQVGGIFVRNNRGEMIALKELVELKEIKTLQRITRKDRQRAISIYSNVKTSESQQTAMSEVETLAKKHLPDGYRLVQTGNAQNFKESFQSLIFALLLGLVVAYMVLGSQYNSFLDPITVLVALPFSISGAFLFLWVFGKSLNLYSMIGLILLMGIVKKNSIMLVDFTNQVRDNGEGDVKNALLHACPNRLRPILMTTASTIVGALPAAMTIGPGAETRSPMAIAVIGGVLLSTLLTLYVVPCFYSLFSKKRVSFEERLS